MNYRRSARSVFLIAIFVLLSCSNPLDLRAQGQEQKSGEGLTQQDRNVLRWYESLKFPRPTSKCLRFARGVVLSDGSKKWETTHQTAFLLESRESEYEVMSLGLQTFTVEKLKPGEVPARVEEDAILVIFSESKYFAVEEIELSQFANEELAEQLSGETRWKDIDGRRLRSAGNDVVLAHACTVHGEEELAHEILRLPTRVPMQLNGIQNTEALWIKELANEYGEMLTWRAMRRFGNLDVSRTELREEFQRIADILPDCKHAGNAIEIVLQLDELIAEDEAHDSAVRPYEELTKTEQIAELIFQLRNQNFHGWTDPEYFGHWAFDRRQESPAKKLIAIGYEAIPTLVESIHDTRLSRSVDYRRSSFYSHNILKVQDCIIDVLQGILQDGRADHLKDVEKEAFVKQISQFALESWLEYQDKGECQFWIDKVRKQNKFGYIKNLAEKYPSAAVEIVSDIWIDQVGAQSQITLMDILKTVPFEQARPIWLAIVRQSTENVAKVYAARLLMENGEREPIEIILKSWKSICSNPKTPCYELRPLIEFLVSCDDPTLVVALSENFSSLRPLIRMQVIAMFGNGREFEWLSSGRELFYPGTHAEFSDSFAKAVESLLLSGLDDQSQVDGLEGKWGEVAFRDPRVCDIAAHVLQQRFPEKYHFDLSGANSARDEQIVTMRVR